MASSKTARPCASLSLLLGFASALPLAPGCDCGPGGSGGERPGPVDTTVTCEEDPPAGTGASVLHGTVIGAEDDAPLAGAVARLEGVAGCVTTDAAGSFSIQVPGGGRFNLALRATDRTHVRRTGSVASGHDQSLGTIALRRLDGAVSQIGAGGGTHESEDGGLTLTFPAGALGKTVNVRATRFDASRELPGPLPPTSHFTMALQATAEEAELQKAVTIAIPNDYGFPPGTAVPVGVFDEASGEWVPDGMGVISADGSQVLYEAAHFSSFDCNYPTTVGDRPAYDARNSRRPKDPCKRNGSTGSSTVDIKTGGLMLDLALPLGRAHDERRTLTLVYRSTAAMPSAWIGGERGETPADLSETPEYGGIEVQVEGLRHTRYVQLDDEANWAAYLWDGSNARGERVPTGLYDAWLRVFYGMRAEFAEAEVFGGPPTRGLGIYADEILEADSTLHSKLALVNGLDSPVAAGWFIGGLPSLHVHPDGTALVVENGESRGVFERTGRLDIIGGGGEAWDCADGDPAANDCFEAPAALAIDADGSVLVGDADTHLIRRITATGTLQTVYDGSAEGLQPQALAVGPGGALWVGDGNTGKLFKLDGGALEFVAGGDMPNPFDPANPPTITNPTGLAFGPQGELYIADWPLGLRRLNADDTMENLSDFFEEPDPPAPFGVAVAPDGSLLMTETNRQRVRRLMPDGRIVNVAGIDTVSGNLGEGGLATRANLSQPAGVAVGADGTVYIADEWNMQVRAVDPETGLIRRVAGSGPGVDIDRVGGVPATEAMVFRPVALVLDSEGKLLISSAHDGLVYAVDFSALLYDRPASSTDRMTREAGDGSYRIARVDGSEERYDSDGRITTRTDHSGRRTSFAYDAEGRLTAITDALDETVTLAYGADGLTDVTDPHGRTIAIGMDAERNLTSVQLADGSTTTLSYGEDHALTGWEDGAGRTAAYRYDAHGRIREVENGDGVVRRYTPLESQSLVNDLIAAGQGASPDDPAAALVTPKAAFVNGAGERFEFDYDSIGEAGAILLPDGTSLEMRNNQCGMPARMTEPGGRTTSAFYDEWGRLRQTTTGHRQRSFEFDEDDPWQLDALHDELGRYVHLGWDDQDNLISVGDGSDDRFSMTYTDGGQLASLTDATGVRWDYAYDARGNLASVTSPLDTDIALQWDARGNLEWEETGAGLHTAYEYDDADRVVAVTDGAGKRHTLQRDGQGLVSGWSVDGVTTTLSRDGTGRVTSVSLAGAPAHTLTRDGEGRVTVATNPLGDTVTYELDGQGRPSRRIASWSGGSITATYEYDARGNLTAMRDDDSEVTFAYGPDDNVISVTQHHDGMAAPITLEYDTDAWGRVNGVTYPALTGFSGGEYTYEYDDFWGYIDGIYDPDYVDWSLYRDEAGRVTSLESNWRDDWDVEYAYDAAGRMTGLTVWADYDRTATLYSLGWTRAGDGRRLVETDPDGTATYSYDAMRRIAGAVYTDGRPDESYAFDARGERSGAGYQHDAYQRMETGAGYSYAYDAAGRVVQRTHDADGSKLELTWDGEDRLIQVDVYDAGSATPDHVVRYRHDADGRRIAREVDGTTAFFIYDREDVVLEVDESGAAAAFYLHGPGEDRPLYVERNGERYAFISDELGTVRGLARLPDRTLVRSYEYSAFGELLSETGTLQQRYGFHGRERDPLTGLIHMRQREYDPAVGRFLTTDPMRFVTMSNPYTFHGDDAVNFIDPEGAGPPRGARAVGWVAKQYNGVSSEAQNLAGRAASAVGGRESGEAAKTIWEYSVQPAIDSAVKLPGYSPGPGPSVSQLAEWSYEAWTAKDPCGRARVGGKVFKWVARNNPKFNKAVDSFVNFRASQVMGR